MKVTVLCVGFSAAYAQSFTFVAADTVLSGPLGSDIGFNTTITNISSSPLTIALVRTMNNLPAGWESAMCFDVCFPSNVDSIATTPDFGSSPIAPSESRAFSLHIFPLVNHGTGVVRIVAKDVRNLADQQALTFTALSVPSLVGDKHREPSEFSLLQNYPNPFNPRTTIRYELRVKSEVRLVVYDLLGREVVTLVNETQDQAGIKSVQWNASGMASGVYLFRLSAGEFSESRKMILQR
jgi:hypothetical protein